MLGKVFQFLCLSLIVLHLVAGSVRAQKRAYQKRSALYALGVLLLCLTIDVVLLWGSGVFHLFFT